MWSWMLNGSGGKPVAVGPAPGCVDDVDIVLVEDNQVLASKEMVPIVYVPR